MTNTNIKDLIKELGGTNEIYTFISSKGLPLKIASIYKWKKNGIPHRYRDLIRDLAHKKNIKFEDNIFENYKATDTTITDDKITTEQNINKSNIHSFKYLHPAVTILMLIVLLGSSLYFINIKYDLENKIHKLEKIISNTSVNDDLNKFKDSTKDNLYKIEELNAYVKTNENIIKENQAQLAELSEKLNKNILSLNKNFDSIENYTISNKNTLYLKILTLLILEKQNINNGKNLGDITKYLNNYIKQIDSPENIKKAFYNIETLSKEKIITKSELKYEIISLIKDSNKLYNNLETPKTLKDKIKYYSRKFIRIGKTNNKLNNQKITNDLLKALENNKFNHILDISKELEKNSNLTHNIKYIIWVKNLEKLILLEQSFDLIINWLIFKGKLID